MKKKKNISNSSSGGALLFAVITAFIVSFLGGTLAMVTCSQCRQIEKEIKRKKAFYWLRAGMEYARYKLRTGLTPGTGTVLYLNQNTADPVVRITIIPDTDNLSDYKIAVEMA